MCTSRAQLSVFDELNLAEIACEKLYPAQRLDCLPQPADGRAARSQATGAAPDAEKDLAEIKRRVPGRHAARRERDRPCRWRI